MAKLFASRAAEEVASRVIEIYGGYGFTREYPVEKYFRDQKVGQIYEGTTNMQLHGHRQAAPGQDGLGNRRGYSPHARFPCATIFPRAHRQLRQRRLEVRCSRRSSSS